MKAKLEQDSEKKLEESVAVTTRMDNIENKLGKLSRFKGKTRESTDAPTEYYTLPKPEPGKKKR